tara:strand:+ start:198 stop:932 length:735 start_codon:yes stop_codon:yes gene_type:complete
MALPLLPLISVGLSAAGSVFSFKQAKEQRDREREAQRDAAKALEEARRKLSVNVLAGLSIAKEPFELEREALLQAGASALQAGVEGDPRGAAATAGRVVQAQQQAQAQQRAAMSKEIQRLDELAAMEESRLQAARAQLDIGEAVGQQQIAAEAREAAAAATTAGVQNIVGMGQTLLGEMDLFADTAAGQAARQGRRFARQQDPSKLTRALGLSDIQAVSSIPTAGLAPMQGAELFTEDIIFRNN